MAENNRQPPNSNIRMGPIMKYTQAKEYLDGHDIPKMFEGLIASLMMEKPENHYDFLDTKLEEIKEMGIENVNWESFIYDMHPSRDPVRQEILHLNKDEDKKKKGQPPFANEDAVEKEDHKQLEDAESYKPELFNLTEPQDDDDL